MGYVTDRKRNATQVFEVFEYLNQVDRNHTGSLSLPGSFKEQRGYRSVRADDVLDALPQYVRSGNSTKRTAEEALSRLANMTTGGYSGKPDAPVWERDYSETKFHHSKLTYMAKDSNRREVTPHVGAFGFSKAFGPSFPLSTSDCEAEAAQLIRNARPTRPDFDLARFIGELKDFPMFFNRGNYLPTKASDVGGGFLNIQFGILPTWSDIQSAAEAILKGNELVTEFAREAAQIHHRARRIYVGSGSYDSDPNQLYMNRAGHLAISNSVPGNLGISYHTGKGYTYARGPRVKLSVGYTHELRAFSTFEWYVGDPDGFVGKMDAYDAAARQIVGGGFTPSVAYELTPFSWMLDWFYDIGGLLAYQQDVADLGLVNRRTGWVAETIYTAWGKALPTPDRPYVSDMSNVSGTITAVSKTQRRRPGSPYSLKPTWDLNPMQWAISAALGLTKADKIPFWKI